MVFAAAGTPIPLYNTFRAEDGITNAHLGWASVGYFVAAAVSLLVCGRLSNHLGRRPVGLAALIVAAIACLILTSINGIPSLLIARFFQGLSCGLASSALGAYVVDSAPARHPWLAAAITGGAPMLGVSLGAITCGALVLHGPSPRTLIFHLALAVLIVCAVFIAISPETMPRRRGALCSLRPELQVPPGSGRLVLAVGAVCVAIWSLGGFYQTFGPSVVARYLGTENPLVVALVFSSVMVLNPLGAPLAGRLGPVKALRIGMAAFVTALVGIIFSLHTGAIMQFIVWSLVIGAAQGLALTGGMRALLAGAQPDERAGLLSTIYLISYMGTAIPVLVAGELTKTVELFQIAVGYAVLGVMAAAIALVAGRPEPAGRQRAS
jgi:MFS family permease